MLQQTAAQLNREDQEVWDRLKSYEETVKTVSNERDELNQELLNAQTKIQIMGSQLQACVSRRDELLKKNDELQQQLQVARIELREMQTVVNEVGSRQSSKANEEYPLGETSRRALHGTALPDYIQMAFAIADGLRNLRDPTHA
jgi:uncharacterized coiled-coil DUF342 family protein